MKRFLFILLLFPVCGWGQMLVYTVAGFYPYHSAPLGDGGPATAATLNGCEGIWMDGNCNLYIADANESIIRKVNTATGIITTIAGTYTHRGYSGDGGPATAAKIYCYGLFADEIGNVYITDRISNRIRRIDAATGIINTIAGGGTSLGDGGPATSAQLNDPVNVYGDKHNNIYIGERGRIRKINSTGIITTIAGTGTAGFYGNGVPATSAQVQGAHGMLFDNAGNFYFADRGNSIIRKINTSGIITTFAGIPDSFGYSGDGGPATAAVLSGPISFVIDYLGNMVIGDNQNNFLRKVDAHTGIITKIAGNDSFAVSEGQPATAAPIHPEFMYLDRAGNIYFSCWYCNLIRKITNYIPAMPGISSECGETGILQVQNVNNVSLYPNPTHDDLTIQSPQSGQVALYNMPGQMVLQQRISSGQNKIDISRLPGGVYVVRMVMEDGSVVVRRVVVGN